MKKRIWELDAFRGICILGMVAVHFVYDLTVLYRLVDWTPPLWFSYLQQWGGVLFLLLSGVCVTLGHHHIRRGLLVFGCGLAVSFVTGMMYLLHMADKAVIIYFGVLHCLGACMLLWHFFRKLPPWVLAALGLPMAAVGILLLQCRFDVPMLLAIFGLANPNFVSADYFPLLPYFGFFLLGGALGKILYQEKTTRFPKVNGDNLVIRSLTFCGRQSLWIYLLHQPILTALFWLIA